MATHRDGHLDDAFRMMQERVGVKAVRMEAHIAHGAALDDQGA